MENSLIIGLALAVLLMLLVMRAKQGKKTPKRKSQGVGNTQGQTPEAMIRTGSIRLDNRFQTARNPTGLGTKVPRPHPPPYPRKKSIRLRSIRFISNSVIRARLPNLWLPIWTAFRMVKRNLKTLSASCSISISKWGMSMFWQTICKNTAN